MPRAKNKQELLDASLANYNKLLDFVDALTKEELHGEFPFENRDRNVRDVLVHLHHWHLMFQDWYSVGMLGEKPDMPARGYTWKTTAQLNQKIWEQYQETDYDKARRLLDSSFNDVRKLIKKHSNEELFEKKRYKWTGTTSMASYMISDTASHYDWALKLLKKYKKSLKDK